MLIKKILCSGIVNKDSTLDDPNVLDIKIFKLYKIYSPLVGTCKTNNDFDLYTGFSFFAYISIMKSKGGEFGVYSDRLIREYVR